MHEVCAALYFQGLRFGIHLVRFETFLRLLESEICPKIVQKTIYLFFYPINFKVNTASCKLAIPYWKAKRLNFHVVPSEPAGDGVNYSYRASKSPYSNFWSILQHVLVCRQLKNESESNKCDQNGSLCK